MEEDNRAMYQRFTDNQNITIRTQLSEVSAHPIQLVGALSYLYSLPDAIKPYELGKPLPRICSRHAYDDCPSCFDNPADWNDHQWVEFEDRINRGEL